MSPTDIPAYMAHVGVAARAAATAMAAASTAAKNDALRGLAARLREHAAELQQANAQDLDAARSAGLAAPLLDRLKLTPQIVETVAEGCEQIAAMPDPVGEISGVKRRPSGISVGQMRVQLGVHPRTVITEIRFYRLGNGVGVIENEPDPDGLSGYFVGEGNVYDSRTPTGNLAAVSTVQLNRLSFDLPIDIPSAVEYLRYPAESPLNTAGSNGQPVGALSPLP